MTLAIYSASQGPIGQTVYTFTGVNVPAIYVPTLTETTRANKSKTNIDYSILVEYPVVATVEGVTTAPNTFRVAFSFTALRIVVATAERERALDEFISFISAPENRKRILEGNAKPE